MRKIAFISACIVLLGCGGAAAPSRTDSANGASPPAAQAPAASTQVASPFDAALAGAHRSDANRARDVFRHPRETLAFFGVQPTQHVIELWPGAGWYTEVLAPALRERGALSVVAPSGQFLAPYRALLAAHPELYDRVQVVEVAPPAALSFGPDASADVVLTFRNVHNWLQGGFADAVMAAAFRVLKPGGVLGVVEHRAAPGTSLEDTKKSGYVTEAEVLALATGAGFALEARSDINDNARDTKDYPQGVWTLPPTLRLGDVDRAKYLAIGESDRMTLRFRKPVQ